MIAFDDGRREDLSEREAGLLRYLIDSGGRLVTREEILRHLWGLNPDRTETRTIDMHVMHLRAKLGDKDQRIAGHRARQGLSVSSRRCRMKPARAFLVWSALAVCAVLVLGAMTWLTRGVLAAERQRVTAERERTAAEARADLEERTRLALWRMDALGAAIMLRENRYPANPREIRPATPLLTTNNPEVLLHFEIRKGGEPISPELDAIDTSAAGNAKVLAERKERLQRLRELLAANPLPGDEWTQLNSAANEGPGLMGMRCPRTRRWNKVTTSSSARTRPATNCGRTKPIRHTAIPASGPSGRRPWRRPWTTPADQSDQQLELPAQATTGACRAQANPPNPDFVAA